MKKIVLFILLFSLGKTYAQRTNDYDNSRPTGTSNDRPGTFGNKPAEDEDYSQIRIIDTSQEVRADLLPYKTDPKVKNDRYYFWYLNNKIHATQGGYNGKLLNGHYIAFYPDKNLKEEGDFKRGLKDGPWKTWNRKGDLTAVTNWNEGVVLPDIQQPFWKKIPFVNKKDQQPQDAKPVDKN